MLIALIAKGMQSKHMVRLNKKMSRNLMATHDRIWNGVVKDVGFLRHMLTEVYVMKAQVN